MTRLQLRTVLLFAIFLIGMIGLFVSGCSSSYIGGRGYLYAPCDRRPGLNLGMGNGDEVWIIQKASATTEQPADDKTPGTGALLAKKSDTELVPIPLKHTDVNASITGFMATTNVAQQYHNPYKEKIEAVYVFPLPHNAAINEFVMVIGERRIRGIIREREEAQKIYNEARSQGYVASLLTQERPNVFTQSVANIEPGKSIDIHITYFNTLAYADGYYEYVFPMVVGPRFNPPGMTDGIGAVGIGNRGASGQSTEVQYLKPGQRSGHDIAMSVHIDAGVPIEQIDSRNHRIAHTQRSAEQADVVLAADDAIPNKDFVLRYKVAGKTIKTAMMIQRNDRGGYFTLMLYPPESLAELPRKPLEMVFTVDVSGSLGGAPFAQAKAATRYALTHMNPQDTFQLIRFSDTADRLASQPLPATPENVDKALRWLNSEEFFVGHGTMLVDGLRASLDFPHDPSRLRFVTFLTDGFIGNEAEALRETHRLLGPSHIFSFGVGSSTNRYLMEHMAKLGSGAVAYLGLNDDADEVMKLFFERISHPAMTDMTIDWNGMQVSDIYPKQRPDLFVGHPVILTGRFTGLVPASITVQGLVAGQVHQITVPLRETRDHTGIAAVWACGKIADIADRATWDQSTEWGPQIKQIALEYGLMSPFTAFVAVDSMTRTAGDHGTRVAVPVPVPDGVRYETTVQEK